MLTNLERRFALETVRRPELKPREHMLKVNPKLSKSAATTRAKKLLKNTDVQEYIEELQADVAAQCGVDAVWVLRKYKNVYKSAMEGYETANGTRKDLSAAKGALDSIVNMLGMNAPTKVDVTIDLSTWLTELPQQLPQQHQEVIDVDPEENE